MATGRDWRGTPACCSSVFHSLMGTDGAAASFFRCTQFVSLTHSSHVMSLDLSKSSGNLCRRDVGDVEGIGGGRKTGRTPIVPDFILLPSPTLRHILRTKCQIGHNFVEAEVERRCIQKGKSDSFRAVPPLLSLSSSFSFFILEGTSLPLIPLHCSSLCVARINDRERCISGKGDEQWTGCMLSVVRR